MDFAQIGLASFGAVAAAISGFLTLREIHRRARTSITVRVGKRYYEYGPKMTPERFATIIEQDFNEGLMNGRRQEPAHSQV